MLGIYYYKHLERVNFNEKISVKDKGDFKKGKEVIETFFLKKQCKFFSRFDKRWT